MPDLVVIFVDHKLQELGSTVIQVLNETFMKIAEGSKKTSIPGNYPGRELALDYCVTKQAKIGKGCFGQRGNV